MEFKRHPERVAQDMIARGWNQAELSRRSRVTEATVSRFLNGNPCSIEKISRMAKALGQPVERYVTVEDLNVEAGDSKDDAKPAPVVAGS